MMKEKGDALSWAMGMRLFYLSAIGDISPSSAVRRQILCRDGMASAEIQKDH